MAIEPARCPFWKALLNDLFCQICTFGIPLIWAVFLWDPIQILLGWKKVAPVDRKTMWKFVPVLIIISIVLPILGLIRAKYLQKMLSDAVDVEARVTRFGMRDVKGWSRVDFAYEYEGASFTGSISIPEVLAEKLSVGFPLPILVPRSAPKKSYLKSTFS